MVYQVNINPKVTIHLGGVYYMRSGKYLRVLHQTAEGWFCEQVDQKYACAIEPRLTLDLLGKFIFMSGKLCWTASEWQARVDRVAYENQQVAKMRERAANAAMQDIARAKEIDRTYKAGAAT